MGADFWTTLEELLAAEPVILFRPVGVRHPGNPGVLHEVQYGTLMDTASPGRPGIDVWRGSDPAGKLDSALYVMDMARHDARVKILLGCTQIEKEAIQHFHSASSKKCVLIRR